MNFSRSLSALILMSLFMSTAQGGLTDLLKPQLVATQFQCDDYAIASAVVTDRQFGAVTDGVSDCTPAVQNAIDAVAQAGGGVVFLPAGRYRFAGNLIVRPAVTIRGDWKNPGQTPASLRVMGTVLMPTAGRGQETGTPFISLQQGGCVRNLSIWYPDQNASDVAPYPWTIAVDSHMGGDNFTVKNVTLVNPYQGLRFVTELSVVRNVFGTPLKTGYSLDGCSDTPRIVTMRFAPKYWLESGLGEPQDRAALTGYIRSNGTGIELRRTDGHDIFDVEITGYHTGIRMDKGEVNGHPYGGMYGVRATGGNVGLEADEVGPACQFTNCNFEGESAGVLANKPFETWLQFEHCRFAGRRALLSAGTGSIQLYGCQAAGDVEMANMGTLNMLACTLATKSNRIILGPCCGRALIIGGIQPGSVENHSAAQVQVNLSPIETSGTPPSPSMPRDPRPARALLFNVCDYGAQADGQVPVPSDNTASFRKALLAAQSAGGGTVYVPAGIYRLNGTLVVPTGVELRGCFDAPHHTQAKGTVLFTTQGRGNKDGAPFISLAPGSGVRGLTVYYPDQKIDQVVAYPWTFRSMGAGCWLIDVTAANPYCLADFGSFPSSGHLLREVIGFPLATGIRVSKGSGTLDGCDFNCHFWSRRFQGAPEPSASNIPARDIEPYFENRVAQFQDGYVIGSCPSELMLNTSLCPGGVAVRFVADGAGAPGGLVINHESDGSTAPMRIEAAAKTGLAIYNLYLDIPAPQSYIAYPDVFGHGQPALYVGKDCSGCVLVSNDASVGSTPVPVIQVLGLGKTTLHNFTLRQDDIVAQRGDVVLQGMSCRTSRNDNISSASSPPTRLVLNGNASESDSFTYPAAKWVSAWGNSKQPSSISLADQFATSYRAGQPAPLCRLASSTQLSASDCKVVPGEGLRGGAGILLTASANSDAKHPVAVWELFRPNGLIVKPTTQLRFWMRPLTEMGRNCIVRVGFANGFQVHGNMFNMSGGSMHPMDMRGAVGKWTRVDCELGAYAPGATISSIVAIFDTGLPMGECRCDLGPIEIGEPMLR